MQLRRLEIRTIGATASATTAASASCIGIGHGFDLLKVRDGHHGQSAILSSGLFRCHKVDTVFAQRIRRGVGDRSGRSSTGYVAFRRGCGPSASATTSATAASCRSLFLLSSNLRRKSGNNYDLAFYVQTGIRVDFGLVDCVTVANEDRITGNVKSIEWWAASASAGSHGPVFTVFEICGSRTSGRTTSAPATSGAIPTAAASTARGRDTRHGSFAVRRNNRLRNEFERHEVGLQRPVRVGCAAAGLQSPFGQMTGNIESRGIESARRQVATFQLIGREEVVVDLQFQFRDGV